MAVSNGAQTAPSAVNEPAKVLGLSRWFKSTVAPVLTSPPTVKGESLARLGSTGQLVATKYVPSGRPVNVQVATGPPDSGKR